MLVSLSAVLAYGTAGELTEEDFYGQSPPVYPSRECSKTISNPLDSQPERRHR